ncbi:MAG: HlyD family secretion protein [Bacteroidetes bacterium]|nr:HlyD family secretion protein [Bacteroidota bacterium]MCL2303337.1 HlyD family secretion protein [Lentimicrobiaceae bacterium]
MEEEKEIKQESIQKEIELKSPAVQEVLGRPPRWIIRWGISIIFIVIAGLVVGSYFFKYPDIIEARIVVTTENLPAGLMAKNSGRIDTIFVSEKQLVKKGDFIALIENPVRFQDVIELKTALQDFNSQYINSTTHDSLFGFRFLFSAQLGEIQPAYEHFVKSYRDYLFFLETQFNTKKIAAIERQIAQYRKIVDKTKTQIRFAASQLQSNEKLYAIDSVLFAKGAISVAEFERARGVYLQQLQSFESTKMSLENLLLSIAQLEQSIFELQQQDLEQKTQLQLNLSSSFNQLQTQLAQWEQSYLLISPIDGFSTMTKYWQHNQNIVAGEVLATIVPQYKTKIIGKIELPPRGAGKVKEGQFVNVKFDNYPYMEYGMMKVQIAHISLVPINRDNQKYFVLEVVFPDSLVTNYGKTLEFSQEMTGTAEIITEDLRLLDRFLNPIKSVIKR